jgi:hypothetical protein
MGMSMNDHHWMEFDNPLWELNDWVCVEGSLTTEELLELVKNNPPPQSWYDEPEWIFEDIDYVI